VCERIEKITINSNWMNMIFMNSTGKRILVIVITLIVLIAIFWYVLPMLGVADKVGSNYWAFSLVGSFILSYFISGLLYKVIK